MRSTFLRWLSALLAACLMLSCPALTEEMQEDAPAAEEAEEITSETVDATVEETETELGDDAVVILVEEAIELSEAEAQAEPEASEALDKVAGGETEALDAVIEEETEGLDKVIEEEPEAQAFDAELPMDGDALFAGYVQGLFGIKTDRLFAARLVGNDLTGEQRSLYGFLKTCAAEVAAGKRASTEFTTTHGYGLSWEQLYGVVNCLIADCPYEMYWYGNHIQILKSGGKLTLLFAVSDSYAADTFRVNTAMTSAATKAAANARAIVSANAAKSDYNKLVAYRDAICNLVSYNDQAVSGFWPESDMDPWQLIWVFDGDRTTDVVCEGYAKAFQYLCDMTKFSGSVMCYCVTGSINGGLHKWNIVRMPNGRNYHVDITWCDSSTGDYDRFFMKAPVSGSVTGGYAFNIRNVKASYRYDAECLSIYTTDDLKLSAGNYLNEINLKSAVSVPGSMKYTVKVGETFQIDLGGAIASSYKSSKRGVATVNGSGLVEAKAAGKTKITIRIGKKKRVLTLTVVDPTIPTKVTLDRSGTLQWYMQDPLTLKATLPAGTSSGIAWKSSNKKVATVANGVVTFRKAGTTTITATATRGKKKAKVKLKVVDGSRATSIRINTPATTTLKVGQTLRLTAAASFPRPPVPSSPAYDPRATWKSSNKKVLAVNRTTGDITARKPGTAVITVTAGSKKKAKIRITVTK